MDAQLAVRSLVAVTHNWLRDDAHDNSALAALSAAVYGAPLRAWWRTSAVGCCCKLAHDRRCLTHGGALLEEGLREEAAGRHVRRAWRDSARALRRAQHGGGGRRRAAAVRRVSDDVVTAELF
ncbi:hypothetical protein F511_30485 [Dorcoceras hygrometricum]|uniref:Uncharacterized protein n=1 Tax=Dorcoceras hygrometricum TaxID=472368 RepID=A0A2Z7B4K1_9LAMI|nr:hypothetical protein F511_30485 [Dorcoceras hygrometricum]